MTRRPELDALRGLMLVLMTLTHLPTRLAQPLGQPFGFVSAAEGFVLLSAYVAGLVYAGRHLREGDAAMRQAFLARAAKIYLCQAALLLYLFTAVAALGVWRHQSAITNMLTFYLEEPLTAFFSGLLLIYNPPLLDILPLYVLFMVASPVLLLHGSERGWRVILAASIGLWLGAQFGLSRWLYEGLAGLAGIRVPFAETGAFGLLSWQLLWVLGLWMGARHAGGAPLAGRFPRWMVAVAVAWAVVCLAWRHAVGQVPFAGMPSWLPLFDKWELGPLRLLNLLALLVVVMRFGPAWAAWLGPRPLLERLGRASLPVFCAHLVAVLIALTLVGEPTPLRPAWVDALLLAATFGGLHAVAWFSGPGGSARAWLRARWWRPAAR